MLKYVKKKKKIYAIFAHNDCGDNPGGMERVDVAANVARLPEEVLSN